MSLALAPPAPTDLAWRVIGLVNLYRLLIPPSLYLLYKFAGENTTLGAALPERTTITRNFTGRPARALVNRVTEEVAEPLSYPAQMSLTAPLRAAGEDAWDLHPMWAGQGAGLARAGGAAEIVERTMGDAERVLADLRA